MNAVPRRQRFLVAWSLRYRRPNQVHWLAGRTINMSISGVLFEAEEALSPDEVIDLSILFEAPNRRLPSTLVKTRGHVVRTEPRLPAVIAVAFE